MWRSLKEWEELTKKWEDTNFVIFFLKKMINE